MLADERPDIYINSQPRETSYSRLLGAILIDERIFMTYKLIESKSENIIVVGGDAWDSSKRTSDWSEWNTVFRPRKKWSAIRFRSLPPTSRPLTLDIRILELSYGSQVLHDPLRSHLFDERSNSQPRRPVSHFVQEALSRNKKSLGMSWF